MTLPRFRPPPIVRWHGPKKASAFLAELYRLAKDEDPESLVTYTSYPTAECTEEYRGHA